MPSRNPIARYVDWLHLQWPAGTVEKRPEVRPDGSTAVPGLYVVGDLTGGRCSWFGQVDRRTGRELRSDPAWLAASPVRRVDLPVRPV
jgi:hypothetical protein